MPRFIAFKLYIELYLVLPSFSLIASYISSCNAISLVIFVCVLFFGSSGWFDFFATVGGGESRAPPLLSVATPFAKSQTLCPSHAAPRTCERRKPKMLHICSNTFHCCGAFIGWWHLFFLPSFTGFWWGTVRAKVTAVGVFPDAIRTDAFRSTFFVPDFVFFFSSISFLFVSFFLCPYLFNENKTEAKERGTVWSEFPCQGRVARRWKEDVVVLLFSPRTPSDDVAGSGVGAAVPVDRIRLQRRP